jgi:hypothetical protein
LFGVFNATAVLCQKAADLSGLAGYTANALPTGVSSRQGKRSGGELMSSKRKGTLLTCLVGVFSAVLFEKAADLSGLVGYTAKAFPAGANSCQGQALPVSGSGNKQQMVYVCLSDMLMAAVMAAYFCVLAGYTADAFHAGDRDKKSKLVIIRLRW